MSVGYGVGPQVDEQQPAEPYGSGWRFLSFAAAVLVVMPLVVFGPGYLENRRVRLQIEADIARGAPIRARVADLRPPLGSTACVPVAQYNQAVLRESGAFCWLQDRGVRGALADLRAALAEVGGTQVVVRCVPGPLAAEACLLRARLVDRPFIANVFPVPSPPPGTRSGVTQVVGGAEEDSTHSTFFSPTLPGDPDSDPTFWGWK